MRLVPGSPAVRAFVRLALLMAGVAVLSFIVGWMAILFR